MRNEPELERRAGWRWFVWESFVPKLWGHGLVFVLLLGLAAMGAGCDKDEPTCPDRIDEVSCGQCPVDAVSGATNQANVCVYCRAGTTCPDDPCSQSCISPDCSLYPVHCGRTAEGGVVVSGLVPYACGCPEVTSQTGVDDVTEGGPYLECTCL